jgi:hypothetical protein
MAIYGAARAFMRAHGNATQWPEGTPSAEQLTADIEGFSDHHAATSRLLVSL